MSTEVSSRARTVGARRPRGDAGDSANTVLSAVFVLVALFLIALFLILGGGGRERVPDLRGDGVGAAADKADSAGFDNVRAHDAWGRDRRVTERGWKVCFQSPDPREGFGPQEQDGDPIYETSETIDVGAVLVTERCPNDYLLDDGRTLGDMGYPNAIEDDRMPNFVPHRTAHMIREILGDGATIRFEKHGVTDRDDFLLTDDLGDWKACWQDPAAGTPYNREPVRVVVRPYLEICQSDDGPSLPEFIGDEPPDDIEH